ncbi:anti-sigma factor [Alicyclobacillus sp. ALC3]|uniref:anti-sigma factor n=1 Tax=Alicyclobacillus sp. ALC3 TaxID=2796143 RepID=UPI002377E705|nr:anti-sigma factor [Alicyclobacillus sp. ALC3]WDL98037.1 anti-sigma factor [Alicyclobacillus sp. ALC3]
MSEYTCEDIDLLAYLQERLTGVEREVVSRHVATCLTCQRDVAQLEQAQTLLPSALAPVDPPVDLKAIVMAEAFKQRSPQEVLRQRSPEEVLRQRSPVGTTYVSSNAYASTDASENADGASSNGRRKRTSFARRMLPWSLSAALFLVSLVLTQQVVHDRQQVNGLQAQLAHATTAVALQPTHILQNASGKAVVIKTGSGIQLIVYISHVTPTRGSEVYHVWLLNHGTRHSAGIITTSSGGTGVLQVSLNGQHAQFDAIGITLEPNAETTEPVGPKVLGTNTL